MDNMDRRTGSERDQFELRWRTLNFIHIAILAGLGMFVFVVVILTKDKLSAVPEFSNPIFLAASVLAVVSVAVASSIHKIAFRPAAGNTNLRAAMDKYQGFVLVRAALVEGGALFSTVVILVTRNAWAFLPMLLCAAALAWFRPSRGEFERLTRSSNRTPGT